MSSLDLSNKPALISAWLNHNKLKSLDLTGDTALVSGELLLNNQNQSFSLLKNRYDNTEAELVELINDQGFKDEYIVDIEIIGFESNEDYKFSYNVDWYEATTENSSYDMSGYDIWAPSSTEYSASEVFRILSKPVRQSRGARNTPRSVTKMNQSSAAREF